MRLKVGVAIGSATDVFQRYFPVVALPLVAVDLFSRGMLAAINHATLPHSHLRFWLPLGGILLGYLLGVVAQCVVSALYLRAVGGDVPRLEQAREVMRYPGLIGFAWRLFWRCLGWALLIATVLLFAWLLADGVWVGLHKVHGAYAQVANQPRRAAGWTRTPLQIVWIICAIFLSRYAFAIPLVAQRRGVFSDLFAESIDRVRPFRWTIALIAGAASLCDWLPFDVQQLLIKHFARYVISKGLLIALVTIVIAVMRTWFMMVFTGWMLQTDSVAGATDTTATAS